MLSDKDFPLCAEMFRRRYNVEIGTREANRAINCPDTDSYGNDLGCHWTRQVEHCINNGEYGSGSWAYWLCYSDDYRRRYSGLPSDLQDARVRAQLPGRAPEL